MEVWMTEGPRVNFVMRKVHFEIYTWILCLSYFHENKQVEFNPYIYTLSKLSRFGYEISVFKYTTGRYSEQPPEQPAHMSRQQFHGKLNVKIFFMFIVAENTGSVNIMKTNTQKALTSRTNDQFLLWINNLFNKVNIKLISSYRINPQLYSTASGNVDTQYFNFRISYGIIIVSIDTATIDILFK